VPLCEQLTQEGIPLNVTALFTLEQVQAVVDAVKGCADLCVGVRRSHRR
jgi:transaldolase